MHKSLGKKIRVIRDTESLSRLEFAKLTGIPTPTQKSYETERRKGVGSEILLNITNHPRFKKYTLWLMVDDLASIPEQIAPELRSEDKE